MADLKDKKNGPTAASDAERRGANRHLFIATADVIDVESGTRFSTRTSDLGPGGCFVDILTPFPVGTQVKVRVRKGTTDFETEGSVVYSQTGLGMGIAFNELSYEQQLELEGWIAELTSGRQIIHDAAPAPKQSAIADHSGQPIFRLVKLLVEKKILTDAEASAVFQKLVI